MAKLGNETKLFLNLAQEKMEQKLRIIKANTVISADKKSGYDLALRDYNETIAEIKNTLERA